jgi:hypothetical protein
MQFALLIFESPEAFAARNADENDPYLVRGGRTTKRSSKPASTSVAIHCNPRRLAPRCD